MANNYAKLGIREFKTSVDSNITKVEMYVEVVEGLSFYSGVIDKVTYHIAIDNNNRYTFYKDSKLYWSLI